MGKMAAIAKYEYKMQVRRRAGWMVLGAVAAAAMADCLPVAVNRERLEFLEDIRYYVWRVFSVDGLILLFGVLFLVGGRLADDRKSGLRELFMAAPVKKAEYIAGKFVGNFLFVLTLMYGLLGIALCGFAAAAGAELGDYMGAVCSVSVFIILPAAFFTAAGGVMFPEVADIRLVYLVYSAQFLGNALSPHTPEVRPFFIVTQGDLAKMVWQHPKYPEIHGGSACLNLLFLAGTGVLAVFLAAVKKGGWREK